jgi:hypothetical protein
VGIATGVASGLLALDIDPQNGGDASYKQLRQQFPAEFAQPLEVRTGSGGTHLYFECRSPTPSLANILPGIDVKADADYVIAPPSLDVAGSHYQFASNSGLVLPPLPAALRDLIFQASSQQSQGQQSQGQQTNPSQQSRSQQSQSQFTAGVQPEPVPWPDLVDGIVLFNELTTALGRYLALPEGALEAMALWILFTHAFDAAEVSPRLALLSPVPECGKTTAFSILSRLVRRALLASNVSAAVVYRVIERDRPTLLMDEGETYMEGREDYRGILNSGHTPDAASVLRADPPNFRQSGSAHGRRSQSRRSASCRQHG